MRAPSFKSWFAQLPSLNQPQRLQTLAALHPAVGLDQVIALIQQIGAARRQCPRCACDRYHRHGHANGLQRYRCRACHRTFNDLSGTPLARLRLREKWLDYLHAVLQSKPVRKAANEVGVHRNTACRWRHRFLDRIKYEHQQQKVTAPFFRGKRSGAATAQREAAPAGQQQQAGGRFRHGAGVEQRDLHAAAHGVVHDLVVVEHAEVDVGAREIVVAGGHAELIGSRGIGRRDAQGGRQGVLAVDTGAAAGNQRVVGRAAMRRSSVAWMCFMKKPPPRRWS